MATIRLVPSTYAVSSTQYLSVSSASNMYHNTDNTTYATITNTNASTSSRYLYLRGFNFDDIPSGAEISSFTVKIKGYESGLATSTSYAPRLANGTSALSNTTASTNFGTSTTTITIPTGALTWQQIADYGSNFTIMVYVRRSNKNTTGYFYCYGAEIEANYTIPTYYNVAATSTVSGVVPSPATQQILEGNSAEIRIDGEDLAGVIVTDNDVDVTNQLEQHLIPTGGSIEKYPGSHTTSNIQSGSSYAAYCIGHSAENPYSSMNNMYSSQSSTGYAEYSFDFSDIPEGVTITNVSLTVTGHRENATISSDRVSRVQAYSGSTAKGEYYEFTSTSNQTHTLENIGTWTRAELLNAKLRHTVGYYGGLVTGVTWAVTYESSGGNPYYWTYTITNINTDHTILIDESGPFIPPDEDPEYNYYPVTISSINAQTDPGTGTVRVQEGTNQIVTIEPLDPQLTLALDNGVDITNELVGSTPTNTYTVTTQVSGASYGFNLNSSTGYYVSTNNGVAKSASVARLNMDFESDCLVTITYINYAEANYDYGLFGKIDTTVATDGLTASSGSSSPSDSTSNYQLAMCSNSSSTQTITYEVPAGQHYIDIKYGKDDGTNSNNDSLQWKVTNIEATSAGGTYTYTLNNISQKHSLVFIFGDVEYYFITSSGNNSRLYPDGQSVVLAGYDYRLLIVPDDASAQVTLKDNNVDMTSSLQYEEATDKTGKKIANYIYELSNIVAQHTITVICGAISQHIYLKINNTWREGSKIWKKINSSWVEQSDFTSVFDSSTNYRKG